MPNIFLIPLYISELTTSQIFFATVWSPGGVIITFAENWNFQLKCFGAFSKSTLRVFWINFLSKNRSKMLKNQVVLMQVNFLSKIGRKYPKTVTHLASKNIKAQFLNILDPLLEKKLIKNTLEVLFSLKKFTKKPFSSKFQFSAKVMMVPKSYKKHFDFWSTQKYSRVTKICLVCAGLFLEICTCSNKSYSIF